MTQQAALTQHKALYDGRARLMSGFVSCQSQFHLISLKDGNEQSDMTRLRKVRERYSRFGRIPWRIDPRVGVSRLYCTKRPIAGSACIARSHRGTRRFRHRDRDTLTQAAPVSERTNAMPCVEPNICSSCSGETLHISVVR